MVIKPELSLPTPPTQLHKQQSKPEHNAQVAQVSKQFESVLMSQLLDVMWRTTGSGLSGPQAGQYQQMFQGAFAEQLVKGGGLGLSGMIARGLGGRQDASQALGQLPQQLERLPDLHMPPSAASHEYAGRTLKLDASEPSTPAVGVLADLQRAASEMLEDGGSERWSRAGQLTPADLASDFATAAAGGAGGEARFSVRDANGYQGYYKCNLFALEMARRADLQVPLVARETGWGFPSTNRVTDDASDGNLNAGWAQVATGASPAAMQDALRAGEAAFLVVGKGSGERPGHMAVVERPREIQYDEGGQIQRIVFDGWEAQPGGARHLEQRAWNRNGQGGAPGDRNDLQDIEIIRLIRKPADQTGERPLSETANSSRLDSASSLDSQRPTQGGREH